MKYILSLIVAFLWLNLSAQSNWSYGVVGGVDYSRVTNGLFLNVLFGELNSGAHPVDYGFRGTLHERYGFQVGYWVSEKQMVRSGVVINAQGGEFGAFIVWPSELDDSGLFVDDLSLSNQQRTKESHRYLEVPLHLRNYLSKGRTSWYLEGGISPNFYLKSSVKAIVDGVGVIEKENKRESLLRAVSATLDFGFGTEFKIGNNTNLFIQPMIRYYWISALKKDYYKAAYFNAGIELGCTYSLN